MFIIYAKQTMDPIKSHKNLFDDFSQWCVKNHFVTCC